MNIQKAIAGLMSVVGLALVAGGAQAQVTIGNSSPNTGNNNITYTTGTPAGGATFTLSDPNQLYKDLFNFALFPDSTVVLTLPGAISGYTTSGPLSFSEMLTGTGTFTITDNTTSNVLLTGTFGSGVLTGTGTTGGLQVNNLTYTGGTRLDGQGPAGSLSVEFVNANFTAGATGVNSFTAKDSATYTANSAVPEPGTYAAFLVGGLGVLGLMAGARKRSALA